MKKIIIFIFFIFLTNLSISQINFGLNTLPTYAEQVFSIDLDGDNDNDIILDYQWYENIDGMGTFDNPREIISEGASYYEIFSCDMLFCKLD